MSREHAGKAWRSQARITHRRALRIVMIGPTFQSTRAGLPVEAGLASTPPLVPAPHKTGYTNIDG